MFVSNVALLNTNIWKCVLIVTRKRWKVRFGRKKFSLVTDYQHNLVTKLISLMTDYTTTRNKAN